MTNVISHDFLLGSQGRGDYSKGQPVPAAFQRELRNSGSGARRIEAGKQNRFFV
jgi:hypothetical protein